MSDDIGRSCAIDAPAKINLTLDITGRRADGYHLLRTVMQTVDLCDTVTLITGGEGIRLTLSDADLPADERNTAWKAAALFYEAAEIDPAVDILIEKRIPQQAGMAGGSADAAAVLRGLNALYDEPLTESVLVMLAEKIGADVPFCVLGGTMLATGIGEELSPLPAMPPVWITVVKPPVGVSTADAYAAVDSAEPVLHSESEDALLAALAAGDAAGVGAHLFNVFDDALAIPAVALVKAAMAAYRPLGCQMTGSGSAVFALFDSEEQAQEAADGLATLGETFVCRPIGAPTAPLIFETE
ncbi:MAG: 4-(cytidine 5'-diphospho)-2-C-methyl-D-erythritol kinase [Clostridia bacterium]|nr:4-(cytidine 5'-diphospho)-2-C-methyl-D-erythritol kinase [Clostridia bacterium]